MTRCPARTRLAIVVAGALAALGLPLGPSIQAAPIDPKVEETPLTDTAEPIEEPADWAAIDQDAQQGSAPEHASESQEPSVANDGAFESEIDAPRDFEIVGIVAEGDGDVPERARVRVRDNDEAWGPWYELEFDPEHGPDVDTPEAARAVPGTDPIYVGEARHVQVQTDDDQDGLTAVTIDSDGSTASLTEKLSALVEGLLRGPPAGSVPGIITRAGWGANEALNNCGPSYGDVKVMFVHHTAGSNDYSEEGAAAVVRSVHEYHTQSRGWCDIGYNFLVDRFGRIYEGRAGGIDRPVAGAHVSGFNSLSSGVSVMGDHEAAGVPGPVVPALGTTIAWKLRLHNVYPIGSTIVTSGGGTKWPAGTLVELRNVSGHRDAGSTSCPGGYLYALVDQAAADAAAKWSGILATYILPGDFDGDGRTDVASFLRGGVGDVFVAISSGASFGPEGKWHEYFAAGNEIPGVGDFNNDGRDDIVTFTGGTSGDVWVALSQGNGFATGVKWNDWFAPAGETPKVGDINGDGRDDIVTFTQQGTARVYVGLSQGNSFQTAGGPWHTWFAPSGETPGVGDFNADGWDDIVTFTRGGTADIYVGLSNGSSAFNTGGAKWHDWFAPPGEDPHVGDFNNDGRDDVITFTKGGTGDVYVGLSTGTAFTTSGKWQDWFAPNNEAPAVGNFNGSGGADIVTFTRDGKGDVYVASTTGAAFTAAQLWQTWLYW